MNRKETILIAVFVNAALLVTLFITGLPGKKEEATLLSSAKIIEEIRPIALPPPPPPKIEIKETQGDEIDQVLKEFSQKSLQRQEVKDPTLKKEEEQKIDFIKELQQTTAAISRPEKITKEDPNFIKVTVKKGDALEKIARANQSSVKEIMESNHLKSTNLTIGQELKIPKKEKTQEVKQERSPPSDPQYYVVKNGDNPWSIALKNQMKIEDLLKLNNLNEEKARNLKAGDKLRIR